MSNLKKMYLILLLAGILLVGVVINTYFFKRADDKYNNRPTMSWVEVSQLANDCKLKDVVIGHSGAGVRFTDGRGFMIVDYPGEIMLRKTVKEAGEKCGYLIPVGIE